MCISKKTYYYNPQLIKCDAGYMVDIYEYNGRKSRLIRCYFDKNYAKVLLRAKVYVDAVMTKCQK